VLRGCARAGAAGQVKGPSVSQYTDVPADDEGEIARVEWELLASWLQLSKLLFEGTDPLEELTH
jgi:hypothetical protein